MKTLIIHPTDTSTDFLKSIYSEGATIINEYLSKRQLKPYLKSHDQIILLGHGTEKGLIGYDKFMIDGSLAYLLKDKNIIGIWCYARAFFERHNLNGFSTGMFISEDYEAEYFNIQASDRDISDSNDRFADAIQGTDYTNIHEYIKLGYPNINDLTNYNITKMENK